MQKNQNKMKIQYRTWLNYKRRIGQERVGHALIPILANSVYTVRIIYLFSGWWCAI